MGIRISALPSIASPALSDIFPVVQDGVTYKETVSQLSTLIGGVVSGSVIGTANQIIVTPGVGNVTLSTPQDIATTSDVTFGSVAFSPTTKGIVGTTTNNDASPGYVGEVISSHILNASAVSFTSTVATNLTSISLTAGDWDVYGNIWANNGGGALNFMQIWTSSTSATQPDFSLQSFTYGSATAVVLGSIAPYQRYSLPSTTTIYLSGVVNSTGGANTCSGGIYARRAH